MTYPTNAYTCQDNIKDDLDDVIDSCVEWIYTDLEKRDLPTINSQEMMMDAHDICDNLIGPDADGVKYPDESLTREQLMMRISDKIEDYVKNN